ncbi:MAG TPA: YwiC-like family protein [Ilumatobacteraceae bacterium]|nr:YwiC-like family protein [Ilumatobacteraceae bacterium]
MTNAAADTAPSHKAGPRRAAASAAAERSLLRSVALPTEHGGWGLTTEPVLLGLIIAWSLSGLALGIAAIAAFLVRTPLKLALIDRRRGRVLPRTKVATKLAAAELALIGALGLFAGLRSGWQWLVPVLIAAPFVAVQMAYDIRSRGRRLIPELAGTVGIAAIAAAILRADHQPWGLAIAVWMVLVARAIVSIPFVRTQVFRLHRGTTDFASTYAWQAVGVAVAGAALVADSSVWGGVATVALIAVLDVLMLQRPPIPAKVNGYRQMALGFLLVAATAVTVLI